MYKIIQKDWLYHFITELKGARTIYLISPFIAKTTVDHLLKHKCKETLINLITRFNLNEFQSGASSLAALKELVDHGVRIKGIKNLHSKLYLFDDKSVIIGSANFTTNGFFNNFEYGIKSIDNEIITTSREYFDSLWRLSPELLDTETIESWEVILKKSSHLITSPKLPDFGTKATIHESIKTKYFVKFFGKTEFRSDLAYHSRSEIERSHCHWALTFSGKKGKPRRYNHGDVVYMARMLNGNDYAIFGKGTALKHIDNRDTASTEDINQIEWKVDWPIYIRVMNTEFIDSSMKNCPKMSDLMECLNYESFYNTQIKHLRGEENINIKCKPS